MKNEHLPELPLASFQVITDTHVRDDADHIHNRHLEQALADIATFSQGSSGIMHVGDVTDRGLPGEYRELERILKQHAENLPDIRYTVGNHDIGAIVFQDPPLPLMAMTSAEVAELLEQDKHVEPTITQTRAESAALVEQLSRGLYTVPAHVSSEGKPVPSEIEPITIAELWHRRLSDFEVTTGMKRSYHDHWINGYHYIFLGTEQPHPKDCELSAEQLVWLELTLSEHAMPDHPIFLFLHQPLMNTVAGSMKEQGWYGVNQDAELKAVLTQYPQAILFTGHTHWQLEAQRTMYDGEGHMPTMFNASSVGYLWTDQDEHLEGSEGLHVEIYKDRVVVKGRNFVTGEWIEGAEFTVHYPVLD
ncbi:metallophosphoesterase [Paenibacillus sp. Root52]|uniref:metallophosphoesterase family protein n=1 Tax=Paenibacillus sp. Root52 TaxID=1736552 RepID=UPI0006F8600D|nr:metallophosphoesterase [Paenibacillus sp. Root52]KQY79936.1 metallophosphoesterase [Paenibacillus sp. Root52]